VTAVLATAAAVAAVVALGAYLRWAVRPAVVAFRVGRAIGRLR
jgi:hypothetical protein